jgi:hypothetical protein
MTITLELSPELEVVLRREAKQAGLDISEYAVRILSQASFSKPQAFEKPTSLLDRLTTLGVIDVVDGASGLVWSDIEAACDPS